MDVGDNPQVAEDQPKAIVTKGEESFLWIIFHLWVADNKNIMIWATSSQLDYNWNYKDWVWLRLLAVGLKCLKFESPSIALATTCADEPFGSLGRSTCIDRNRPGDGSVGSGLEGFHPPDSRSYPCHGERHAGMGKHGRISRWEGWYWVIFGDMYDS